MRANGIQMVNRCLFALISDRSSDSRNVRETRQRSTHSQRTDIARERYHRILDIGGRVTENTPFLRHHTFRAHVPTTLYYGNPLVKLHQRFSSRAWAIAKYYQLQGRIADNERA
jgi:hypothetical protein